MKEYFTKPTKPLIGILLITVLALLYGGIFTFLTGAAIWILIFLLVVVYAVIYVNEDFKIWIYNVCMYNDFERKNMYHPSSLVFNTRRISTHFIFISALWLGLYWTVGIAVFFMMFGCIYFEDIACDRHNQDTDLNLDLNTVKERTEHMKQQQVLFNKVLDSFEIKG